MIVFFSSVMVIKTRYKASCAHRQCESSVGIEKEG